MAKLTYEENLEMFRNRKVLDTPNIRQITDVSKLEALVDFLRETQHGNGGKEYVLAPWIGPVGGPFRLKGSPGPTFYGNELKQKEEMYLYYKRGGSDILEWDPHMGQYWSMRRLKAKIEFLKNGKSSTRDTSYLLEAEA